MSGAVTNTTVRLARLVHSLREATRAGLLPRLRYEAMQRILPRMRPGTRERLLGVEHRSAPPLRPGYLAGLRVDRLQPESDHASVRPTIDVDFLGLRRALDVPIRWNDLREDRLWRFHLHYFQWALSRLEQAYRGSEDAATVAREIEVAMRDWVDGNPFYTFDGWHPYPTSMRIVSWTYLLSALPTLASQDITASLWQQIRYLAVSLETHAGGNHLLENYRALVIAGSAFTGEEAESIVARALEGLDHELGRQLLEDGCHFERSSSYHLQVLTSVAEAVACLESTGRAVPASIRHSLAQMLTFARSMRLSSGLYPLWNDAAYDAARPLDEVLQFGHCILESANVDQGDDSTGMRPLHTRLLDASPVRGAERGGSQATPNPTRLRRRRSAGASGYHVFRGEGVEVAFDAAAFAAPGNAGHGHADCLTVDVYKGALPLIVETGTSRYEAGETRSYERGSAAHNTVVIGGLDQSEVWGSFRTGRRARVIDHRSGKHDGWDWAAAGHDGYDRPPTNSLHHRWVGVKGATVVILDCLSTRRSTHFVTTFHLGPEVEVVQEGPLDFVLTACGERCWLTLLGLAADDEARHLSAQESGSWYAPAFGVRSPRSTIVVKGDLQEGVRTHCTLISPERIDFALERDSGMARLYRLSGAQGPDVHSGWARQLGLPLIAWELRSTGPSIVDGNPE